MLHSYCHDCCNYNGHNYYNYNYNCQLYYYSCLKKVVIGSILPTQGLE